MLHPIFDAVSRVVEIVKTLSFRDVVILVLLALLGIGIYVLWDELQESSVRNLLTERQYVGDTINGCTLMKYAAPGFTEWSVIRFTPYDRAENYVMVYSVRRRQGGFSQQESVEYCERLKAMPQ